MGNQVIVSFENETIKVIHASHRHGNLSIDKSFSFSSEEFDHYLATTTDNEFVVVNDFYEMYQDVVSLPPAKEKYLRSLVEIEIKKSFTDLKDFSFFYLAIKETQREGRWLKDIFFFVVNNADLNALIARFSKHDKIITHLYPDVILLANAIEVDDVEPDQPLLGVIDMGTHKTMFLVKEKKLLFVRVAQSDQKGISPIDIESVNMTIAYCRQTLRINPVRVVFLDTPDIRETPADTSAPPLDTGLRLATAVNARKAGINPIIPEAPMKYPSHVTAFNETIEEYITPISAVLYEKDCQDSDMLPGSYRSIFVQRKVLTYSVIVFAILTLMGLGYIGLKIYDIASTSSNISMLRKDIGTRQPIIGDYGNTSRELQTLMPPVNFMNQVNSSPDMQKVLSALQVLNIKNVSIKSIGIRTDKDTYQIIVDGNIGAKTFTDLQMHYHAVLDELKKIKELEVAAQVLDLRQWSFKIELKWKTQ